MRNSILKQGHFCYFIAILCILFIVLGFGVSLANTTEVRIGVLAKRGDQICLEQWSPTAAYLSSKLPEYSFSIIPLSFDEIVPAVVGQDVDFILANSAIYIGLEVMYGASYIATMKNLLNKQESKEFGGTIFYKSGRNDIQSWSDLAGKSFMGVDRTSFGGWLMAQRELKLNKIDPDKDFSKLLFGDTHDAVVYAVLSGKVDVGTVRTDTLERMAMEKKIHLGDFEVLPFSHKYFVNHAGEYIHKHQYEKFPFMVSTHLYPEWPFIKMQETSDGLCREVAHALYNMPALSEAARKANISGWTIPLQYQSVRECLQELRVWPYQDLGKISLADVLREYWHLLILILACVLGLGAIIIFVVHFNKKLAQNKIVLEQYKDELEDRVEKRTAELKYINTELHQKIIEKNLAEEKLKKWAHVFQYAEWGVVVSDAEGKKIEIMNPAFAKMHGYSVEELTGQYCMNLFPEEERKTISSYMDKAYQSGHYVFESSHLKKDGTLFPVVIDISVVQSPDGKPQYHIINIQDISSRKKAEEEKAKLELEILHIQKMESLGTLAGGIAHDFNNILAVIVGFSELAKLEIPGENKGQEEIDQVLKAAARATELVTQILAFSRKSEHKLQFVMPHVIIKEALKMLRSSLPTTIKIQDEIDVDCGLIQVDPTNLHQVVMNLCTNALHAMDEEKGLLSVSLCRKYMGAADITEVNVLPGEFIVLTVRDSGHGMDEATRKRIFEPYFTTKDMGKGTGLGLAVIHGIVQDYHGFIQVESELGEGSSFQIYLPAVEMDVTPSKEIKDEEDYQTGTEQVLVVDDEESIVNLNSAVLERLGYIVTCETDSLKALEKFRTDPDRFDLIITDQTMPNLTGAELAKEVLKIKPDLPIILCTGYSSVFSEEDALAVGIKRYIKKPVSSIILAKYARQVLDKE